MDKFNTLYEKIINEDNGLNPGYKILEITMDLDNSAFNEDDNKEMRNLEIIRILKNIISDIENGRNIENNWPLIDINGNNVGSLKYIEN